jgi:hypothetical protein
VSIPVEKRTGGRYLSITQAPKTEECGDRKEAVAYDELVVLGSRVIFAG